MFEIDMRDFRKLTKIYKAAPKKMTRVTAAMLNEFAFGNRKKSLEIIHQQLTVRNKRFIDGTMQVEKARGGMPINRQVSRFGSVVRPRYTGLAEQETGKAQKRTHFPAPEARGGDMKKQVRPSVRLKSTNQFVSPDDYSGSNMEHRVVGMLAHLKRISYRKPFVIKGHSKFHSGLYKFKSRKLVMIQTFKRVSVVPKKVRWLRRGRINYFKGVDMKKLWGQKVDWVFGNK